VADLCLVHIGLPRGERCKSLTSFQLPFGLLGYEPAARWRTRRYAPLDQRFAEIGSLWCLHYDQIVPWTGAQGRHSAIL